MADCYRHKFGALKKYIQSSIFLIFVRADFDNRKYYAVLLYLIILYANAPTKEWLQGVHT